MLLFAYSLLMSLLHSLWQAGALFMLYQATAATVLKKGAPATRRNLLVLAIGIQVVLSAITFLFYCLQPVSEQPFLQGWMQFTVTGSLLHTAAPWLIAGYIAVLVTKFTQLLSGWYRFRQLYKAGLQKPTAELKVFATLTAHHLGIKKKVQLWFSTTISTPVTFGFFKPVILLPVALVNQLSLQQAEALVVHELTHIKVNDYLVNWFLSAAGAIFFFNPFVGQLCSHARLEREKNCDINVLHFGSNALQYAETLLLAAKMQREKLHWQLAAVGVKKQLLQRIHFFTAEGVYTHRKKSLAAVAVSLLAVAFAGIMGVMALLPAQQKSTAAATASVVAAPAGSIENGLVNIQAPAPPKMKMPVVKNTSKVLPAKTSTRPPVTVKEVPAVMTATIALPAGAERVAFGSNELEKQVIIEEQASGGNPSSIALYVLQFKNGQWVLSPKWKATSQKILVDTGLLKMDSLRIRLVQEQ
jgi:beta-lactamase regulating signal transducer with metallopeptidase domain